MHRRVALLAVVALAVAGAPVPAQAGTALDRGPVGWSGAGSSSQRRTVMEYWTPERMRAARPLSAPTPRRGTSSGGPTQGTPWATRGVAGSRRITTSSWTGSRTGAAASSLAGSTAAAARRAAPAQDSPGQAWADGGGVARTVGRVFFTTAEGRTASCSGTAVTSANQSVVMTAGHCVKMNGAAHRNWVFVPGFDDGRRPFGTWVATRLLTTQQWNTNEDINFDVAAAVVAPLQGRTLTDVVGGQGVAFNQPTGRQMFSFGYPAAAPFDGSDLVFCSGRVFKDPVRTRDQGLRCAMTGGSSGGPWFEGFDTSSGLGWLNSVNSFKYDFAPDFMFGPFFGNEAMAVYQAAQRSGAA
ncbi:trypsin-like serine peptidase [Nonomuraea sp. NPDC050227]|uniref:trypsin-like serine peptidase n=1 Tax=Nonomuraea sp. NPDC050227 TaxID=3364360 RepID=UPI0037BBC81F